MCGNTSAAWSMRLGILADRSSVGVAGRSSLALRAGDPWARRLPMADFDAADATRHIGACTVGRFAEAVAHLMAGGGRRAGCAGADLGAFSLTLGHHGGDERHDSATDEQQHHNNRHSDYPSTGGMRL